MIIDLTGKKLVVESSHHTCPFHGKNPGVSYAGCTCSGSYSGRYVPDSLQACTKCNGSGLEPDPTPDPNPPQACTKCNGAGVSDAA